MNQLASDTHGSCRLKSPRYEDTIQQIAFAQTFCKPKKQPTRKLSLEQFRVVLAQSELQPEVTENEQDIVRLAEILTSSTKERNGLLKGVGIKPPKRESRVARLQKRMLEGFHSETVFEDNLKLRRAVLSLQPQLTQPPASKDEKALDLYDHCALSIIVMAIDHGIPNLNLAIALLCGLVTDGYKIGAVCYTHCRYGEYAGEPSLLTHSMPVSREFAVAVEGLIDQCGVSSREDLAEAISAHETLERTLHWLRELGFTDRTELQSGFSEFERLLVSEVTLSCPPPIRATFLGPVSIAAWTPQMRMRYHSTTLMVPHSFDDEALKSQCARDLGAQSASRSASNQKETNPITNGDDLLTDLCRMIDEVGQRSGKQAPKFRQFLRDALDSYVQSIGWVVSVHQRLAIAYLYEICEHGIQQAQNDPTKGAPNTIRGYLKIVFPYLEAVFTDENSLDDEEAIDQRTVEYLRHLGDKRQYAEQPIDYALNLLYEAGDFLRPDPSLIYSGKPLKRLARSYLLNHRNYVEFIEFLARTTDDEALRLRYILSALLQYRLCMRVGETHVVQYQNLGVRDITSPNESDQFLLNITADVRRRGKHRPKSSAGNRSIDALVVDCTEDELWAIQKFEEIQSKQSDRTRYLFMTGDSKNDLLENQQTERHLRAALKWVTKDPDATLHCAFRKSGINSSVLQGLAGAPNTKALAQIVDAKRASPRPMPRSLQAIGQRHINVPSALAAQAGHSDFSAVTLPNYVVHQAELYLEYWDKREVPTLSNLLARRLAPESKASFVTKQESAAALKARLRSLPELFAVPSMQSTHRPRALPNAPGSTSHKTVDLLDESLVSPTDIFQILTTGEWPGLSSVAGCSEVTLAAIGSVKEAAHQIATGVCLPTSYLTSNTRESSANQPFLEVYRALSVRQVLAKIESLDNARQVFEPGGLWQRLYVALPHLSPEGCDSRPDEYFLIEETQDLNLLMRFLTELGYQAEHLSASVRSGSRHHQQLKQLGIPTNVSERGIKLLGRDDRIVLELGSADKNLLRYPSSVFVAGFICSVHKCLFAPTSEATLSEGSTT